MIGGRGRAKYSDLSVESRFSPLNKDSGNLHLVEKRSWSRVSSLKFTQKIMAAKTPNYACKWSIYFADLTKSKQKPISAWSCLKYFIDSIPFTRVVFLSHSFVKEVYFLLGDKLSWACSPLPSLSQDCGEQFLYIFKEFTMI